MATSESARARRFALPDLEDERTGESIHAFIEGPHVRRSRPSGQPAGATAKLAVSPAAERTPPRHRRTTDLRSLPGRLDWNAALARESVRAARYGRPASVAIVELRPDHAGQAVDPWLRALAGPIARALRHDSRATDLVARVASTRFQMLLPETSEAGASRMAQRVAATCRTFVEKAAAPIVVRVSVAGTGFDETLENALAHALRTIEAA